MSRMKAQHILSPLWSSSALARHLQTTLLLFNGTMSFPPNILAARPAAIIKSKAFSICSTRPERPAVKDGLSQVKVTMVTAEVALDRVI